MKARPRIQVILLIANLVMLLLPLGGIAILRLYESALIRQTESELIAQAAFVSAAYRAALKQGFKTMGKSPDEIRNYGVLPEQPWRTAEQISDPFSKPATNLSAETSSGIWRPNPPKLDLAVDAVLPPPEDAVTPASVSTAVDLIAGDLIVPIMRDAQVVTLAGIRVVDTKGIVIATTGTELGQSILHRQEVSRALKGEYVSLLRRRISDDPPPPLMSISRGTNLRVFVAMPIYLDNRIVGATVLSRTPRNIAHALYGKRYVLLNGMLILIGVVVLLTLFTSFAINSPIKKLITQSQRAIRGEKGAVKALDKPVTKEVEQLSHAIAQMAATLEHRADYFQNFAAHVSHAFKTPLTAIQGAVEILQDHFDDMPLEKRRKFLSNIAEDSRRLDALVRKLFDLAKADTVQVGSHNTNVNNRLDELIRTHTTTTMDIRLNTTNVYTINMDGTLFDSIVNTILENAIQQSATEMEIRMDRDKNNNVHIYLQDNGPGVSTANAAHIFEPFFTTRHEQGGTGLGLAVAKRLAMAHGGDLTLIEFLGHRQGLQTGATFCLSLPICSMEH